MHHHHQHNKKVVLGKACHDPNIIAMQRGKETSHGVLWDSWRAVMHCAASTYPMLAQLLEASIYNIRFEPTRHLGSDEQSTFRRHLVKVTHWHGV